MIINMKSEISLNGIDIVRVPEIYNFTSFIGMSGYSIFFCR